jgi:hypothetical protein
MKLQYIYPPANAVPPRHRGDYRGVLIRRMFIQNWYYMTLTARIWRVSGKYVIVLYKIIQYFNGVLLNNHKSNSKICLMLVVRLLPGGVWVEL